MRLGLTLFKYIGRQYLLWLLVFLFGLSAIILLFEVAELLRRAADVPTATFPIVMQMGFFKLPDTIEKVLPFVVLFSAMFTFWRLTRSQELIIVRASGVSVWQFLAPVVAVTFLASLINVTIVNPVGADMIARYWQLESNYLYRSATLELTGAGLWLRQKSGNYEYLLHSDHVTLNPVTLSPLMCIVYDKQGRYVGRIDAPKAILKDNIWHIENAWFNEHGQPPQIMRTYRIGTNMTLEKLQESMAAPNTISFWNLPNFISNMHNIGLPTVRHKMAFQGLLAQPWFLSSMVLFAAVCSLRFTRRGGTLYLAMVGVAIGAFAFALNSVLGALGQNQSLPIALAVWATPLLCLASAVTALLFLEDG